GHGGLDVRSDMHTRQFGTTRLNTLLPPWAQAAAHGGLVEHLRSPGSRKRMRSFRSILTSLGDWSRVVLLDMAPWPQYSRRSLAEIAAERGQDPFDAALDLLIEEPEQGPPFMVILLCYTAEQPADVFRHPLCMP